MDDRQRLEAIVSVINKYLPPFGMHIMDAMSAIISLVDPLPPQPAQERPWVGLTREEFEECYESINEPMDDWALGLAIEAKLKDKNT
jgi:hypothetical protein